MNAIRQRKLLKSAALLAAALGMTLSTTVQAQTPPSTDDQPTHYAQYPPAGEQPSESTEPVPPDNQPEQPSQGQASGDAMLNSDVQAFKDFVDNEAPQSSEEAQVQEDQAKAISTYVEDGTKLLSDAIATLIPEENKVLKERHKAWNGRIDMLGDHNEENYSQQARDVLIEGAQLLTALQVDAYPGQSQGVSQLMESAENIDAEAEITEQQKAFENYLTQASALVEEMDRARETQTSALTPSLVPASYPMLAQNDGAQDEGMPAEESEDGMFDWVPGVGEDEPKKSADKFSNFIQRTENEGISNHGEFVREGIKAMDDAISQVVPDDNQVLNDELSRLKDKSGELDDTAADDYVEKVRTAFYDRAMLMTAIQQAEFPDHGAQVQSLRMAAESIDINQGLAEQDRALMNYFNTASETLSSMADIEQDATASAEGMEGAPPVNDTIEEPMFEDEMAYDEELGQAEEDLIMEEEQAIDDDMAFDEELGLSDEELTMEEEQAIEDEMAMGPDSSVESETPMGAEGEMPREGMPEENIGGGPALTPEVQAYVDFVAMTGEIDMSMNPEDVAVEGMRLLDGALSSFIESGQQDIEDKRVELTKAIDKLEEDRGDEAFTSTLNEGMDKGVSLFEAIQQNTYPESLEIVSQIEMASDRFNEDMPVEEQTDALLSYFESSRDAVQTMDIQRRGAQAQLIERGLFF
ncbi:hypothetical protein EA187_06505 [Lujinxingia sediminis]|uniref:DUF4175 domain-containing protein n=1 Tax=Lujinxingia sediminis TaxID=2480984 RepID=A0ABY0CUN8_9DELT|nr:hypothetical protein [Lujinxingia sediminis]RVU46782.1 hypothetical protein EA187_06505 [Lujinxingia sediminis]